MSGTGILEQYGQVYEGSFVDNKREGHGVLQYNDGSIYTGPFKNGLPEGDGVLRTQVGMLIESANL